MIELAVNFNIVTKYTSFVAVGNKIRCSQQQIIDKDTCFGPYGYHNLNTENDISIFTDTIDKQSTQKRRKCMYITKIVI